MTAKVAKYSFVLKTSIMDALVYVVDFFGRSGFFAFIMLIYLMLWRAIYGGGDGVIEGYTLNMMIWYLVMTEIVTLSDSAFYSEVSEDIKTGNIAYLLNKPYHYVVYTYFNNLGKILIRFVVNSVVGVTVALLFVGVPDKFDWMCVPFVIMALLLGISLNFFVNLSLALSAFWVEENMPFRWIYQKLIFTLGGMLLPLELFPDALAKVSRYLPFAFVTYGPAKLFVDFDFQGLGVLLIGQLIYLTAAILICLSVYRKGVTQLNVNGG